MIRLFVGGSDDLRHFAPRNSFLKIGEGAEIEFQGDASIATHCDILVVDSKLIFGHHFSCNNGCKISSVRGITFGENVLLGGNIEIRDSDGHRIFDIDEEGDTVNQHESGKQVRIGNHVWIASEVHILKGVDIPDNSVVGYGSICTHRIDEENTLIAGYPAKVIKRNITWDY